MVPTFPHDALGSERRWQAPYPCIRLGIPPTPPTASHQLAHHVRGDGERDLAAIGGSLGERFGEMEGLLRLDLRRHRRLVGVDHRFDEARAGYGQRLSQLLAATFRILDADGAKA